jgi:hypothetical protein
MRYQPVQVGVRTEAGELLIFDVLTRDEVVGYLLSICKGKIITNNNHYRDLSQTIANHESDISAQLGKVIGQRLCRCLNTSVPNNYKDQLVGLKGY